MIIFKGLKTVNKVPFLRFANEAGQIVEIPTDPLTSERVRRYLDKLGKPTVAGDVESDEEYDPSDL